MNRIKANLHSETVFGALFFVFLFSFPFFISEYKFLNISNYMGTMLLALSLVLIWGITGIFSFGQAALFGVGGYTYGILSIAMDNRALTPVALLAALAAGFFVAVLLGYFMFYGGINDVFVGLITLCVTLVAETFMAQTAGPQWKVFGISLGGFNGINGIPRLTFGSYTPGNRAYYYIVYAILLLTYIGVRHVARTKIGYVLVSIRENRQRSAMLGYNTAFYQMMVFGVSGAIAALSGVLYTCWGSYIVPASMNTTNATVPVVLVAAGGKKSPTASLIFALLYLQLSQDLAASGSQYALVILGLILIFVLLFVPDGILSTLFGFLDRAVFHTAGARQ